MFRRLVYTQVSSYLGSLTVPHLRHLVLSLAAAAFTSAHAAGSPALLGITLGMDWDQAKAQVKSLCLSMSGCGFVDNTDDKAPFKPNLHSEARDLNHGCPSLYVNGVRIGEQRTLVVSHVYVTYTCLTAKPSEALDALVQQYGPATDRIVHTEATDRRVFVDAIWSTPPMSIGSVMQTPRPGSTGFRWPERGILRYARLWKRTDGGPLVGEVAVGLIDGALEHAAEVAAGKTAAEGVRLKMGL